MATGTIKAVVGKDAIADNLTTNDSTKVLSAKQGKALSDKIGTVPSGQTVEGQISSLSDQITALNNNFKRLTTTTSSGDTKTVFVQWLNDNNSSLPTNNGSNIAFRVSNYPNYDVAYGIICKVTASYGRMYIVSYYSNISGEYVLSAGTWSAV